MESKIIFKNYSYTFTEFAAISLPKSINWAASIQSFVKSWLSGQTTFELQTSGSSGKPKVISINKKQMEASAKATINFLDLKPQTKALLCMNAEMIGGKMMLVRAMLGEWHLHTIEPTSFPVINEPVDFLAIVPLQLQKLLGDEKGRLFLDSTKKVIIGGAPLNEELRKEIQSLRCEIYQTFGMTETVSHIALKALNGTSQNNAYEIIGDNEIQIAENGQLSVRGSVTKQLWIETNDIVEKSPGGFLWKGRADLVINSGGVKISIEELERTLKEITGFDILIWKANHETLGEQVIGIVQSQKAYQKIQEQKGAIMRQLPKYHFPREWRMAEYFEKTLSGKTNRLKTYNESRPI